MDLKNVFTGKNLLSRIARKRRLFLSTFCSRSRVKINLDKPIVSFSFDDAPRTAFTRGGDILNSYGAQATFFVSLGMLECDSPSGRIASRDDLCRAVEEGHELGCHTYDHRNPWKTNCKDFEQSVLRNREALAAILPGMIFNSFAYPLTGPNPAIKRRMGVLFNCCRWGGQNLNSGAIDLNLLKAFFLDVKSGFTADTVKRLIDRNAELRGWLIFATHDVDRNPSIYGCSEKSFQEVVGHAAGSGSLLLPVGKAFERLQFVKSVF